MITDRPRGKPNGHRNSDGAKLARLLACNASMIANVTRGEKNLSRAPTYSQVLVVGQP